MVLTNFKCFFAFFCLFYNWDDPVVGSYWQKVIGFVVLEKLLDTDTNT